MEIASRKSADQFLKKIRSPEKRRSRSFRQLWRKEAISILISIFIDIALRVSGFWVFLPVARIIALVLCSIARQQKTPIWSELQILFCCSRPGHFLTGLSHFLSTELIETCFLLLIFLIHPGYSERVTLASNSRWPWVLGVAHEDCNLQPPATNY